jgi:hypothetical protein
LAFDFSGQKGITPFLFVRTGIVWGLGKKSYGGHFGTDWGLHSAERIEKLYTTLYDVLARDQRHGPFDALFLLVGENRAREVSVEEEIIPRSPSLSKRATEEYQEEPLPDESLGLGWKGGSEKRRRL